MDCTLHEVVEAGVYPYRCHRCSRCFPCGHWLIGYRLWVCRRPIGLGLSAPIGWVPTQFGPGVPVGSPLLPTSPHTRRLGR